MTVGVYPGSFDPVTLGHLDIIKRSSKIVDRLIIGVLNNSAKKPVFTAEERVHMLELVIKDIPNAAVETFDGLTVEFAKSLGATVMFRGLRAVTDFEYEIQMAFLNNKMAPNIETFFLMTTENLSYISSSSIKQIVKFGGNISGLVPSVIEQDIIHKILE